MMQVNPTAASTSAGKSPSPPARSPLSTWERLVCVPLGFLWLAILLTLAIPVCIYMTILYFALRGARWLAGNVPVDRPADRKGTGGGNR